MALNSFVLTDEEAKNVAIIRKEIDTILEDMSKAQRKYRALKEEIFYRRNIGREESSRFIINDNVALFTK